MREEADMSEERDVLESLEQTLRELLEEGLDLEDRRAALREVTSAMDAARADLYEPGDMQRATQAVNRTLAKVIRPHIEQVGFFALRRVQESIREELAELKLGKDSQGRARLWNLQRLLRSVQVVLLFYCHWRGPGKRLSEFAGAIGASTSPSASRK